MQDTDYAISEMDRCLNELKLQGIQIGTNVNGLNLSELQFAPIFQHAEKIDCPIFIHPWEMFGEKHIEKYWLPWLVGMPAETSRAICSLIFGGIIFNSDLLFLFYIVTGLCGMIFNQRTNPSKFAVCTVDKIG